MNVVIVGLGQYEKGSGIAAAFYFARKKASVVVTDFYYTPAMAANAARLKAFKNVRCVFNAHPLAEIRKADLVIKHQRIRMNEPEIVEALKQGIPIETAESIFLKQCLAPVVGITGTRGKSTTTTLVAEMLRATRKNVWLGGNILTSPLTFLSKVKPADIVVLELSSFQLEGTGMAGVSPRVACLTNLMRDHLNAYSSIEEYGEAKAQIFRHQSPEDTVVLNADDPFCASKIKEAPGRVLLFAKKRSARVHAWFTKEALVMRDGTREIVLAPVKTLRVFGEHNHLNMLAAALTARAAGASVVGIKKALRAFRGLPHRQELVGVSRGVSYINDSTATTPDGTLAALHALSPRVATLHLILGGADKELDFSALAADLAARHVDILVLPGSAHDILTKALKKKRVAFDDAADLREAVMLFSLRAQRGDAIVLSPGCASFGQFTNEFDRGDQFTALVADLDKKGK